jgi:hypothetical protein
MADSQKRRRYTGLYISFGPVSANGRLFLLLSIVLDHAGNLFVFFVDMFLMPLGLSAIPYKGPASIAVLIFIDLSPFFRVISHYEIDAIGEGNNAVRLFVQDSDFLCRNSFCAAFVQSRLQ